MPAAEPSAEQTTQQAETTPAAEVSAQIGEAGHMALSEALELYEELSAEERDSDELFNQLGELKNCSGRFAYQSDNGSRYVSDVEFYLSGGKIYCTVSYTGYMGEIKDGPVSVSQESDYSFESFPKGDLYGREQDFTIRFAPEKLYIAWADDIEYVLTRGDGSAESVEERHATFEETGILDTIRDTVDEGYEDIPHNVFYDEETKTLSIALAVPQWVENLSQAVKQNDTAVFSSWQQLTASTVSAAKDLTELSIIATYFENGMICHYVDTVYFYLVGMLDPVNSYANNEMLLWIEDGTIKFNIMDKSTYSALPDTE